MCKPNYSPTVYTFYSLGTAARPAGFGTKVSLGLLHVKVWGAVWNSSAILSALHLF